MAKDVQSLTLKFIMSPSSEAKALEGDIVKIFKNTSDYQHGSISLISVDPCHSAFNIYCDECDDVARTREAIQKVIDMVKRNYL